MIGFESQSRCYALRALLGNIKPMQQTALSFSTEGHRIVALVTFAARSESISWEVITPQLIGRAVRQQSCVVGTVGLGVYESG